MCNILCISTVHALFTSSTTFVNIFIISSVTDNWLSSISDKKTRSYGYLEKSGLIFIDSIKI